MKKGLRFAQIAALALVLLCAGLLICQRVQVIRAQKENAALVSQIGLLLPERTFGSTADHSDPEMPALQIGGTDYVCLLEVPAFGVELPVGNQWQPEALKRRPCKFWGSIYDGTCILGGSNREGQFDFCRLLDVGDEITVTDMQGSVFRCRVERIDRSGSAAFDRLYDERYPLTLFVREEYDARYIVVRCGWAY